MQNKNIMFSGSGVININNTSQIQTYNCNIQGGVWNCNNQIYMFINNTKIRNVQINNNYSMYRFDNVTGTLRLLASNGLYVRYGSVLNVNFNNVTNLENTNNGQYKGLITYNGQII